MCDGIPAVQGRSDWIIILKKRSSPPSLSHPLPFSLSLSASGPTIKYKTNYQRTCIYIYVWGFIRVIRRASRWIRIVKFGPINSGKSFNLNRTLTLRIYVYVCVCVCIRWGSGRWSQGSRNVETAKPFYHHYIYTRPALRRDLLKPLNTLFRAKNIYIYVYVLSEEKERRRGLRQISSSTFIYV